MLREQIKHAGQNFLAAVAIFVLAAALSYVESAAKNLNLPEYVIIGTRVIAVALYIVDGIVVVGTAIILAVRLLNQQATSKE